MSTAITDLPLEVFEVLDRFFKTRHLARLFMTGDAKLTALLCACRRRVCKLTAHLQSSSSLVERLLFRYSHTVKTKIELVKLNLLSSVRRLTVVESTHSGGGYDSVVDMSSLVNLEHLCVQNPWLAAQSIVLPESITTVELSNVGCDAPIANLESCSNLKRLALNSFATQPVLESFLASVKWPPSLDSLRLSVGTGYDCGVLAALLPNAISALSITARHTSVVIDVSPLIANLLSLRVLTIGVAKASVTQNLPSTLEVFIVTKLVMPKAHDVLPLFLRIPASVKRFAFFSIEPLDNGRIHADDLQDAYRLVLPRLPLKDIVSAMYFAQPRNLIGRVDAKLTFGPFLHKFGLADKLVQLCDDGDFNLCLVPLTEDSLTRAFSSDDLSPQSIVKAMNTISFGNNVSCHPSVTAGQDERNEVFRASLHLVQASITKSLVLCELSYDDVIISPAALRRLVSIWTTTSSSSSFAALIASNVFVSLEEIHIQCSARALFFGPDAVLSVDSIVTTVCDNAQNLPRLELLDYTTIEDKLSPVVERLLEDRLRLRHNAREKRAVFSVRLSRPSAM
jgi:hypothetical protein